jgi:hypothetical protein
MIEKIVQFGNTDRVKRKVDECRDAGIHITENVISATIIGTYNGEDVLSCRRKSTDQWEITYHKKFWEEIVLCETGNFEDVKTGCVKKPIDI